MKNLPSRFTRPIFVLGLSALLLCAFFASISRPAHAQATFTVTNTNSSGSGSLRNAINNANLNVGGDEIVFDIPGCSATTPCVISLSNPLPLITDTLTISGIGASSLIVDGNNSSRIFNIANVAVTISDVTIRNGNTTGRGGGIRSLGNLTLVGVHLQNNIAGEEGGGVYAAGNLTILDSFLTENTSSSDGGGIFAETDLTLVNTELISNAGNRGAGAFGGTDVSVTGGSFALNQSAWDGGGLYASNSAMVTGTLFLSNTTPSGFSYGGGLYAGADSEVREAWFEGNTAGSGGGLYVDNALILANTTFLRNSSDSDNGGGAYAGGDVSITGGRFEENTSGGSGYGGGLFGGGLLNSTVIVSGTVFLNNIGGDADSGSGGGGMFTYGNAWLYNSWFEGNHTDIDGGGASVQGTLYLENTTFINNSADIGGGAYSDEAMTVSGGWFEGNLSDEGAGLCTYATADIMDTFFVNNTANYGAGLYVYGDVSLHGGVFEQNESTVDGGGAYIYGVAALSGTSFSNNVAGTDGGGLWSYTALLTETTFLTNTAGVAGGGLHANVIQGTGGVFQGNVSQYGGGIYSFTSLDVSDVYFTQNHATEYGGGVFGVGQIHVTGSHFHQNTSGLNGGGVAGIPSVEGVGETEILDSLFTENTAVGGGGAVALGSPFGALSYSMVIQTSTFLDNHAEAGGGIYYALDDGQIVNSLFAGNTAVIDGSSLGLYTFGEVSLLHNTIVGDPQNLVSGMRLHNGTFFIRNTIFSQHNTAILNVNGNLNQDFNLFYENTVNISGASTGGSNTISGDPRFFAPLQDDYHLSIGSAAFDTGMDVGVNVDADGDPRPYGPGFDIGYDEAAPILGLAILYTPSPTATVGSTVAFTGTVTSGNAITYAWDFGDGSPTEMGNPITHIYTAPGVYIVTLTATNASGSVSASVEIEVVEIKTPPVTYLVFLPTIIR